MDFVFGTLATDALRLLHHRIARTGVQHAHQTTPLDPLPGQDVTLTVRIGQDMPVQHVACYYTTDGSWPQGERGVAQNGNVVHLEQIGIQWDTPTMSYSTMWQGVIPGQAENTFVRYSISAWSDDGPEAFADWPALKATTERASAAFFRGEELPDMPPIGSTEPDTFVYHVDHYAPPAWARDCVMYHIFVDRFYPGDGENWRDVEDINDFYGGTLWGVRDKLDYIQGLGADCIWLSPIFPSPTHHGYDATDYETVEQRMGGDEALRALVAGAHERGIRIILDLVANHISDAHPYFQDALQDENSPYRQWFIFDDSEIGYETFFGVQSMPIVNLKNPGARRWMLDIAQYWLREFDVDGYRLDHANGPAPDFWADFRVACREVKPDCFLFGEVVEAPDIQRAYAGRLDGLLDFHLEDALRKTFAWGTMTEEALARFAAYHAAYFAGDLLMPTFLDNHDMDRFLFVAKNDKNALRRAATFQMSLPNPPIIYYGTEVGMTQEHGREDGYGLEESRLPMPWGDEQDKDLLAFYKQIIAARRQRQ